MLLFLFQISLHACIPAIQYFSCMSISMSSATCVCCSSIVSINLYIYILVQSFVLVCYMPTVVCQIVCLREISYLELSTYYYKQITMWYMPAYMPNIHYAKSYVFAYDNLYICYSAIISMLVSMLSTIYLFICQMLYPICCVLYAGYHMPRLICQFLYVDAMG
jgi:hypothetical protein